MKVLVVSEYSLHLMMMMPVAEALAHLTDGSTKYRCTTDELDRPYTDFVSNDTIKQFESKDVTVTGRDVPWEENIFRLIGDYEPDLILWWNGVSGGEHVLPFVRRTNKVAVCEIGFFPQRSHLYMDTKGINYLSSIRDRVSPEITDVQRNLLHRKLGEYKRRTLKEDPTFSETGYIFVPLQLEDDTQISVFSPHFKRMHDLVDFVSSSFPDERVIVKPHPLDRNSYASTWANVAVCEDANTHQLIKNAKYVIGINSTVLLESVIYGKPVAALGNGISTGKGVLLDAADDPSAILRIAKYVPDVKAQESFLYDLLFNCQVHVGELGDGNVVEHYDVDTEGLERWCSNNLSLEEAERPQVSIIVPCFNQARYLTESVGSIQVQTLDDWECIIVNDGSPDDTRDVALALMVRDHRVKYVEQSNKGLSGARNHGLRVANGRYIQFLDADDLLDPTKLERQASELSSSDEPALAYCDYRNTMEDGSPADPTLYKTPRLDPRDPLADLALNWERTKTIPIHCFLFDRRLFTERSLHFDEFLPTHEDWDCWMSIMSARPKISYIPNQLATYRRHCRGMTTDVSAMRDGFLSAIRKQMRLHPDDSELQAVLQQKLEITERDYRIWEEDLNRQAALKREAGDTPARLIAFYLPQYHPIPENDQWWGKDFTEWVNVKRAESLFEGHYQPHEPGELGYYDLRSADVRKAQADLAREHGIEGFCYWHYWFNGKRLLEMPFNAVLESGEPDFPFCLAWANENWTRNWDGHANEVLQAQEYGGEEDDTAHFNWLLKAFKDRRYIRVDGKPMFLVYRPHDLPDASATIALWRRLAQESGLPGLYLVAIRISDDATEPGYWTEHGFDDELVFQPTFADLWNAFGAGEIDGTANKSDRDEDEALEPGLILSYKDAWPVMADGEHGDAIRTVVPCWDNTARRKLGAFVLRDSSPDMYEEWLRREIERLGDKPDDHKLVFINAWNEWGEGNHLEPDRRYGRGYLLATKRAMVSAAVTQLHSAGRIAHAIAKLEDHLTADPDYAQGYNDLGVLYCEAGNAEQAELHLEKAYSLNASDDTFRRNLADLYEALGRIDDAVALRPSVPEPGLSAADMPLEIGRKPRIIAILAVFNEGDIIRPVIEDLISQDIECYILDHNSTDNSVEQIADLVGKGIINIEKFPQDCGMQIPDNTFSLRYILMRKEQLVRQLGPAWYINADVDEFRESPWPGLNLREGIERVDAQGYNAINFAIFDFKPTDNSFVPGDDVRKYLTHYSDAKCSWDNMQVRCWKHWGQEFSMWQTGGHLIEFEDRRIYPVPFVLRHYAIRSQQHGELKVFNERKKRFDENERAAQWHVQYDTIAEEKHNFLSDKSELEEYDRDKVCTQILRRYAGIRSVEEMQHRVEESTENLTSIVILAFNQLEYTKQCIESVRRHTRQPYELVIVDNGSTDGTAAYLREFQASWEESRDTIDPCQAVKTVCHDRNLGYAAGNNSGIEASEGAYVCILNNDIVVTPGWLEHMTSCAESDPRIGIVGPMSNNVSGNQRVPTVPYDEDTLDGMEEFVARWTAERGSRYEDALRLIGFCMLVKRVVIEKIGGLDTRFGLGNYEDDDFCFRASIAGFRHMIARMAFVHHFGSRTFKGERIDHESLMAENWAIFKAKWGLPMGLPLRAAYDPGMVLSQPFDPELHYVSLSARSGEMQGGRWFAAPDWAHPSWEDIVEQYIRSNRAGDGSLLQLYAGHLTTSDPDSACERVTTLIGNLDVNEDECPDIEITTELPHSRSSRIILMGGTLDGKLQKQFPGQCIPVHHLDKAA